jgi:membrane associated rhomboid family serine protease
MCISLIARINLNTINNKDEFLMENEFATLGLTGFCFGVFCAYWAKETSRDILVWFLLGMFLTPFAGLFILSKLFSKKEST